MRRPLLLFLLFAPSLLRAQNSAFLARLDTIFTAQTGTDRAGCAVSATDDGKLIAARGYGMSDIGQGLAITPHSIFHVASVSKQFTAMSLVLLAQAGKLSLDDDIRKYLPEMPQYTYPVTIRHMLQHTSGVRDQWSLLVTAGWRLGDDLITEQDVLDIVPAQKSLNFKPGTDWNYSNSGFTLAAVIVKRVTGRSLRQFADSAIFQPLGMHDTHFHDDNLEIVPGRTRGYTRRANVWKETVPNYSTVGATSLFTTVEDLSKWQVNLADAKVGGRSAIETLTKRTVLASGDTIGYALGIFNESYRGVPLLQHSGGDPGYVAYSMAFPNTRSGVAVLCNTSGPYNPQALAESVADAMLGSKLAAKPALPAQVAKSAVAGAEGLYWADSTEASGRIATDSGGAVWTDGPQTTRLRAASDGWQMGGGSAVLHRRADGTLLLTGITGAPTVFRRVEASAPTAAERAALAGDYVSSEIDTRWQLKVDGDQLMLHRRKFPDVRLTPLFKDTYTAQSPFGNAVLRVVRDAKGRAIAFTAGSGRVRHLRFDRVQK